MKKSTLIFCLLLTISAFAQDKLRLVNSGQLLREGIQYHDEEKYDKAILKYKQIPENDTNYVLAQFELGLTYMAQKSFDKAIDLYTNILQSESQYRSSFFQQLGNAYSQNKQLDKALETYRLGLKEFPYYFRYYSEMGAACFINDQPVLALKYLDSCLKINFTYGRAHYLMGQVCAKNNYFIPAMLSYQMAAYLSYDDEVGLNALVEIQKIANGEIIINKDSITKLFPDNENNFEEIDEIIRSKSELSEKYKVKPAVNLPFDALVKGLHLVNNRISMFPEGKGWYYENLVPIYNAWWAKKEFPIMMYRMCNAVNNEQTKKMFAKNKPKIEKHFYEFFNSLLDTRFTYQGRINGKTEVYKHIFTYATNNLFMIMPKDEDYDLSKPHEPKTGYYRYFYNNGVIKSEGNYTDGKQDGIWKYYNEDATQYSTIDNISEKEYTITKYYTNGQKRSYEHIKDGLTIDNYLQYYSNGVLEQKLPIKENHIDGEFAIYYDNGQVRRSNKMVKGKIADGEEIYYHPNGVILSKGTNKNDKAEGEYTEYYEDGKIKFTRIYKDGKANGPAKEYFRNGQVSEEYTYVDDKYDGVYKSYYDNGVLEREAKYVKGESIGKTKLYDFDGKLFAEYLDGKNKIKSATYYDKTGKVIYTVDAQKNELDLKKYNALGIVIEEGKVKKDFRVGTWKFYSDGGALLYIKTYDDKGVFNGKVEKYLVGEILDERYEMKDDEYDGTYIEYFINGNKLREGNYVKGNKEGPWKYYFNNKNIRDEIYYHEDKMVGIRRIYNPDGKLKTIEEYKEGYIYKVKLFNSEGKMISSDTTGFPYGNLILKYENGNTYCHTSYKNGKKHGKQYFYYSNGFTKNIEEYVDGVQTGLEINYHSNGKPEYKCKYVNGDLDSTYTWFTESGQVEVRRNYKYDREDGTETYYAFNGKVEMTGNNKYDDREGWFEYFSADGNLQYRILYHMGIQLAYSYKGKNGKFVDSIPFVKGSGEMFASFQNGNTSSKCSFVNGKRNGTYTRYYSNGKKEFEATYKFGYYDGLYTEYYENGNIRIQVNYDNNHKTGIQKEFDQTGKLVKETPYEIDYINGVQKIYSNGKLIQSLTYYYDDTADK